MFQNVSAAKGFSISFSAKSVVEHALGLSQLFSRHIIKKAKGKGSRGMYPYLSWSFILHLLMITEGPRYIQFGGHT